MAFSVAPLLKRQSPSHAYGHGWIAADKGRRWHPAISQTELLAGLTGKRNESWLTRLKVSLFR
ncbi:phage filamentation protein Fil family protein [Pantoea sp. RHCKP32]|uniref:phage filamentation protein Fil family protein n=1 Tax=Pantoea sp. RHCKP32 TaxID=3425182 RepID=UPI003DA14258